MALSPYNPEMVLAGKYKLRDLTITNQPYPNMPYTEAELNNLKWLARTLIELESDIGPFTLLSAFRSPEVNNAVKGLPQGTTSTTKSFHEVGMAVDFYPTSMSINEYYAKILAGPWKNKLGEIALKPSQNSIHISLPTEKYQGVAMIMDSAGKYVRQTADQIAEITKPFTTMIADYTTDLFSDDPAPANLIKAGINLKTVAIALGGVATLGLLFLFMGPKKQ